MITEYAKKPEYACSTRYTKSWEYAVKPFLKWAGGKGLIFKETEEYHHNLEGPRIVASDSERRIVRIAGETEF